MGIGFDFIGSKSVAYPDILSAMWSDRSFQKNSFYYYLQEPKSPPTTFLDVPQTSGMLSFAWWNTSVTLYNGKKGSADFQTAYSVILKLATEYDCVGLGEFDDDALYEQIAVSLPKNRQIVQLPEDDAQNVRFNSAVIYNTDVLTDDFASGQFITNLFDSDRSVCDGQYRIAQRIRFRLSVLNGLIDVYLVHWRQHDGKFELAHKRKAASQIHQDVFGSRGERLKSAAAVVLGDFNAEPYESVLEQLRVSRSKSFADKKGGFFNPFWRKLHDEYATFNGDNTEELRVLQCFFDYIMISSSFVRLPGFSCEERILDDALYCPAASEHRPVSLRITWKI